MQKLGERNEQEALQLDESFRETLSRVRPYILQLTSAENAVSCKIWLDKLSTASSQRRLRNEYLLQLWKQLKSGKIEGIFSRPPPSGLLLPFPKSYHMVCISSSLSDLSDFALRPHRSFFKPSAKCIQHQQSKALIKQRMMDSKLLKESQRSCVFQCPGYIEDVNHLPASITQLTSDVSTLKAKLMDVQRTKTSFERSCKEVMEEYHCTVIEQIVALKQQIEEAQLKYKVLDSSVANLIQRLEEIIHGKDNETKVMEKQWMEKIEELCNRLDVFMTEKNKELEVKQEIIERRDLELSQKDEERREEIEFLSNRILDLETKMETKIKNEDKLPAMLLEKYTMMKEDFNKARIEIDHDTQKQNKNLIYKVSSLKKAVLKLQKSKEKLGHDYEKKILFMIKNKDLEIKTLQLQLQEQKNELCTSLSVRKQNEMDTMVSSLEQQYRSRLAEIEAMSESQTHEYLRDKGGFVTVYDDQGEPLQDVETPRHSVAQVTALGWHPERRWLAAGWESGELKVWPGDTGSIEFNLIVAPHRDPINILQWSQHGGRLVSADAGGSIVGWKIDSRGQMLMMFHHELKDSFVQIVFRNVAPRAAIDMSGLAKAAVAGDERALDLFSSWRPRTAAPTMHTSQKENHAFYIGTTNSVIYFVDSEGQCSEVLSLSNASLQFLLHHQTRDSVVIMTEGLNISHFQSDAITGRLTELTKVKLSSRSDISRIGASLCWAGANTLAILTGELGVRCWDLHTGDTYVLSPPDSSNGNIATPQEICTGVAFCKQNATLAAGTNLGTIYLWKRRFEAEGDEDVWPAVPESCNIHGTVKQLTWGATLLRSPLLAVNCITNVFVLHQQPMCAAFNNGVCASQLSPTQILVETEESSFVLKAEIQVQLVAVNKEYLAISSGRQIATYRINKDKDSANAMMIASFNCESEKLLIYEHSLIILTPVVIQLRSIEGSLSQLLPTLSEEGEPITMDLTKQFLTVASLNGILKIWDLSKREAKLYTRAMAAYEAISDFAEIIEASCNADCRFVSITVAMANLMPSSTLYIWDIESDQIHEFDFAESNDFEEDETLASKCRGKLVTAHRWDLEDPRLIICRAQRIESKESKESKLGDIYAAPVVLVSMFVTSDHGIVIQDVKPVKDENCKILGVHVPFIIVLNSEKTADRSSKVFRILMRDFEELETCDDIIKKAVLDFSFYISVANMDEAFKAIKSIKNEGIWKSLARMCVKTKQLNMALLCLGHMKQAKAARALRQAMQDESLSLEAKIGVLAVELGLYNDAERLFREAKRLDLLGKLLEARNKYKDSIELAKTENKICEKTSCYNYARALEKDARIQEAIDMFTRAECHRSEVPRMLLARPRELLTYLNNSEDPEIKNWHAQYIESTGDMEGALRLYEQAKNTLAMTRLLCYFGREEDVSDLVSRTNHAASAFHLAAHYESKNNPAQAIHFYTIAKAYTNAIRLCKEHNLFEELWPLAILASRQSQIDVAKFYEENDQLDKAVLLYHKAGFLHKAMDIAFNTKQYSALQLIIMDVNADSDPALIDKCAEYFVENDQIEKAVDLFATGKKYMEALELIQGHNILLNEDLAEKMTLEKVENNPEQEKVRILVLERIGEIAFEQGNYHLATKKFTQAGNKLRAMKALLKSGDTEKICFFAQVSRQREIYIMAGNYLQSLDWQNQPGVLKNIINFYSKGKAMDLLANFYVACAQVEIDEFQNYEKALDALSQASRCLAKVASPRDPEIHKRAVELVNNRISAIRRYLDIKKLLDRGETVSAMQQVRQLLDSQGSDLEQSVRRGDLFATLTQHYIDIGDTDKARATVEELKRLVPGINLSYYYNVAVLEALGYKMKIQRQESSDKEDDIEELLGE